MTSRPPLKPQSRGMRLLAAVIIALAALGITCMADRWLGDAPDLAAPRPTSSP